MRRFELGFGLLAFLLTLGLVGCDDETGTCDDLMAPAAPRGLTSVTGDHAVYLAWYPNGELDIDGYRIYRNNQPSGVYDRIGWVAANHRAEFTDFEAINGRTYWYAVSAVDLTGNESDFSPEEVFDTPRPEGVGVALRNYYADPDRSAYDFHAENLGRGRVTGYDDPFADIAFVRDGDSGSWMYGLEDPPGSGVYVELQDMGFVGSLDEISWAPADGWSPRAAVELIVGHAYVVWTRDDHYAKFRVVDLRPDDVVFDWAYQTSIGNQELREETPIVPAGAPPAPPRSAKAPQAQARR
jgi:hypothetical protein